MIFSHWFAIGSSHMWWNIVWRILKVLYEWRSIVSIIRALLYIKIRSPAQNWSNSYSIIYYIYVSCFVCAHTSTVFLTSFELATLCDRLVNKSSHRFKAKNKTFMCILYFKLHITLALELKFILMVIILFENISLCNTCF